MIGDYAFKFEPTAWLGVLRVGIYTLGLFWNPGFSDPQMAGLIAFLELVLTTINRSLVAPSSTARSSVTVTTTETTPRVPDPGESGPR